MLKKYIILILVLLTSSTGVFSSVNNDSITISLLTAEPGEKVYERFGHTAIRIRMGKDTDVVFNYGLFSFSSPNFLYRFVKGETDYQLGLTQFPYFNMDYALRGSKVYEQTLNIPQKDAINIFTALQENYLPHNKVYRYNYFYDNCSTRPRDIIEKNISDRVYYPGLDTIQQLTYRDYVHQKTGIDPWYTFGIDLCLGYKADRKIDYRQEMFLPEKLKDAFDVAIISGEEGDRPLISSQKVYNENNKEKEAKEKGFFDVFTPRLFFWLIFGIVLVITSFELLRFKTFAVVDFIIFLCCGLAGCVIWFLNFFSEHPTVDGNLNCLWLRPLYVVVAILVWVKVAKKVLFYYHFINFVLVTLLLLCMWVLPQTFNPAFIPIILTIILRSGINVKTIKPYRRKEIRRYR